MDISGRVLLVVAVIHISGVATKDTVLKTTEADLWDKLLTNYGRKTRPPPEYWSNKTIVDLNYQPIKLLNVNQREQKITMAVCLTMFWDDERLKWDRRKYAWRFTNIPIESIWYPRLAHYKSIDGNYKLGQIEDSTTFVNFKGAVKWAGAETFTSPCDFDVTYFPFDTQHCYQYIQPWPQPSMVDIIKTWRSVYVRDQLKKYEEDAEWKLINLTLENRVVPPLAQWFDNDTEIVVKLVLKRKPQYYMNAILLPSSMLSVLVLFVFFIPAESGEKLSFGVTLLLTFSVFQIMIESNLPKTSESTPIVTRVLLLLQALSATSILISIMVLNLHHLGPVLGRKMSKTIHYIFFGVLARAMCYSSVLRLLPSRTSTADEEGFDKHIRQENRLNGIYRLNRINYEANTMPPELRIISRQFKRIIEHTEKLARKIEEDEATETLELEWKLAALVIDRFLMIICVLVILTVQIALYVLLIFN